MTEEMKANDATRYLVVGMHNGSGPAAFKVVGIVDSEGKASEVAKDHASRDPGAIYGVYQKLGTARTVSKVEWKGAAG